MSLDKDNDAQEAFNMIDYFKRNGVLVKELKEDIGNYKSGDLVIDMAQSQAVAMPTTHSLQGLQRICLGCYVRRVASQLPQIWEGSSPNLSLRTVLSMEN